MARKRKAADIKADDETKADGQPNGNGIGHNSELTDEQRMALTFQHKRTYETTFAAKKKADADHKNACKKARAELGAGAVDDIKLMIALEDEKGDEAFKARIERELRVARWMGAASGTQFDIFDTGGVPAVDRAFDEGKRTGMEGKPKSPPYDPSVPQFGAWMDGWDKGQQAIFSIKAPGEGEGAAAH